MLKYIEEICACQHNNQTEVSIAEAFKLLGSCQNREEYLSLAKQLICKGFRIVPARLTITEQGKKYQPLIKWREGYDAEKAIEKLKESNVLQLSAKRIGLLDIDDVEKFSQQVMQITEFLEEAKNEFFAGVKTFRGYHLYTEFAGESRHENYLGSLGFEVKTGAKFLITLPLWRGAKIGDKEAYQLLWCNPEPQKGKIFQLLAEKVKQVRQARQGIEEAQNGSMIEEIAQAVAPFWVQGQRQDLAMYLSGWLLKLGYSQEEVQSVLKRVCELAGDKDVKQRLSALQNAVQRLERGEEIRGWSGLVEILAPDTLHQLQQVAGIKILAKQTVNAVQTLMETTGEICEDGNPDVGGAVLVPLYLLTDEDGRRVGVRVKVVDTGEVVDLESLEIPEIQKKTWITPWKRGKYAQYLRDLLAFTIASIERKVLIRRTGWHQDNYITPMVQIPDRYELCDSFKRGIARHLTPPPNTEEYFSLCKEVLKQGKLASILLVASAGAICLKDLDVPGYAVLVTGVAGAGKTLSCRLATALYTNPNKPLSLSMTKTAAERIFSSLQDSAILLDEVKLTWDEAVEDIVFALSSGQGKKRSNTRLEVKWDDFRIVAFLTGEKEISFSARGAYRRFLGLHATSWEDFCNGFEPGDVAKVLRRSWGGCWLLAQTWVQKKDEILQQLAELPVPGHAQWWEAVWAGLLLWEKFFGECFEETRRNLERLASEYDKKLKQDFATEALEKLAEWIVEHRANFLPAASTPKPLLGKIGWKVDAEEEDNYIYVTYTAFRKFCSEYGYEPHTLLSVWFERGWIISSGSRRGQVRKRLSDINVWCVAIKKDALEKHLGDFYDSLAIEEQVFADFDF